MTDLELELRVGAPEGRSLPVEVLRSPAGEASERGSFPFDDLELDNRLKDLQIALLGRASTRRRVVAEHEQAVQRLGGELFDAVFTGETLSLLDRSREQAIASGAALRIQLRFESADMAALPWEFLYDRRRDEYLALSRTTPLVRYVELAEPQRPLAVARPIRLLGMIASPNDLDPLDVDQERSRIEDALRGLEGQIDLHWLDGMTWRALQDALRRDRWHAFHFVGHGGFDAERREGMLALCDDAGGTHRLSATDLGILLGDHETLRLAVLNSCDGARADRLDIFSSTASVLVRKGTPAVLAMQYEITDSAALELSRSFYEAIAAGLAVDAAVTEARKAVALALPGTVEWGTPVLHLRAENGRVFDVEPGPPLRPARAPASSRPSRRPDRRVLVGAGAAAIALVVVLALALAGGGGEPAASGLGTNTGDVATGVLTVHTVELPPGTVALVTATTDDAVLDIDLGVVSDRAAALELARSLGIALADFDGAFDEYTGLPAGQVVGRVDETGGGGDERLVVLAPDGGRFDIVVGGAAATAGPVTLDVTTVDVDARSSGAEYLRDVLDTAGPHLTESAREELARFGAVNLPYEEAAE